MPAAGENALNFCEKLLFSSNLGSGLIFSKGLKRVNSIPVFEFSELTKESEISSPEI